MNIKLISPSQLKTVLLTTDFSESECIERTHQCETMQIKEELKGEIRKMESQKRQIKMWLQRREALEQTLQDLLGRRKAIENKHQLVKLKYDHYHYPYRGTGSKKQELNDIRLSNMQKRRRVRQMELHIQQLSRLEREKGAMTVQVPCRDKDHSNEWVERMQGIKRRYLTGQSAFRRGKIKHDFNLWLQEQRRTKSTDRRACQLCSPPKFQSKASSTCQGLLSPRYTSIYR